MKLTLPQSWLRRLGSSYEIRIRITLGLMFLLIIVANLNSLRFFGQSRSLQTETVKYRAMENLDRLARLLKPSPVELVRSTQFRDLAHASGLNDVQVVETGLLQGDDDRKSRIVDAGTLLRLRERYDRPKEVAGAVGGGLPASLSEIYRTADGHFVRAVAYHFVSDKAEELTMMATVSAETEVSLRRFAALNTLFQLLSIAAAFTIAVLLLKITLKPYRQIKTQALAAAVAGNDRPESVDFAVETFQRVINELRHKEAVLQRLYAQQKNRVASLEQYNEYILASMPSAVISCDTEGLVTHFNRAAEQIFMVAATSAVGKEYHYALAEYPVFIGMIEAALTQSQETSQPECEIAFGSERQLWLSLSCSLLRDSDGTVMGAMVLFSDLTDLKRLESEIALKEQMAALGEMAAGLAHQLRNSFAAVVGFTQMLRKATTGNSSVYELVTNILNEAQATEAMLTRFLRLSRREEIALREVEFSEIKDVVETHFAEATRSGLAAIIFVVPEGIPRIECDPMLIGNSLINLIQNGIEASERGSEIRVVVDHLGGHDPLEIRVIDNGKGISPAEIDKIFLPFYTSGKADGTGLGLALVRKWVISHNGEISCQSRLGKGTTFLIRLPLKSSTVVTASPGEKFRLVKV